MTVSASTADLQNAVAHSALRELWTQAGLPRAALERVHLPGTDPVVESSFRVGAALQASIAAAALAATELGSRRGGPAQGVSVSAADAVREAACRFTVNGKEPKVWDKLSGLYRCGDGRWVRIHANFAHHRDGALSLLGLPSGDETSRDQVTEALARWTAFGFEQAAADRGLVVAAVRTAQEWHEHPQSRAIADLPLAEFEDLRVAAEPLSWTPVAPGARPLTGLRVLDLTRILAGPVAGRTLAAYGADVLLVNGPHLPNIEAIAETSRGKRSAHVDLRTESGRQTLRQLVRDADVLIQGYRPGALAARGFGAAELAQLKPGLVVVSLCAYGRAGPWAARRGFDSLVQSATGLNTEEAQAFDSPTPRALPLQALDYGAGFLMAFGACAALLRQCSQGGSWQVHVSLARVAQWLRDLGRVETAAGTSWPGFDEVMETSATGFGELRAARHAARLSATPAGWDRPAMPPGSHPAAWTV